MLNELDMGLFDIENLNNDVDDMKNEKAEIPEQIYKLKSLTLEILEAKKYIKQYNDKIPRIYLLAFLNLILVFIFTTLGRIITPDSYLFGCIFSGLSGGTITQIGLNYMAKHNMNYSKYRNAKKLLKSCDKDDIQRQIEEKEKQKELIEQKIKTITTKLSEHSKSQFEIGIETKNVMPKLSKCEGMPKQVDDLVKRIDAKISELEKGTYNSSNETEENSKNMLDNRFIQIVYDGKLYNIPLDQYILLNIKQQNDIEIILENDCIIRDGKDNEETFKINNSLRKAYLSRLSKLNINREIKEYLKRYDNYIEYSDASSIISIKTMVNELAYIYYLEYTKKFNDSINLTSEPLTTVRLDKGLDKTLIKKMK